jgi:polar amino acid transport system permease protein
MGVTGFVTPQHLSRALRAPPVGMTRARTLGENATIQPDTGAEALASPSADEPASSERDVQSVKPVPRRHPGRWATSGVAILLVAMAVHSLVTNPRFQWNVVGEYFATASVLHGLAVTLGLTAAVMLCGYLIGIGIAAMRLSANPVLRMLTFGYVWFIRSVPPLVQLLFWYELASLYPELSLGIPFGHVFVTVKTAHLFTALLAAFVGLTLDVAAFSSEIVRGGVLSVPSGQPEAAAALGMTKWLIFRRIILPQAIPAIVPASGNLLIGMVKVTSIVSVLAVQDLLYSVQLIYTQNFLIIPLLMVATIWYIIVTTVLSIGQYSVERHYARGMLHRPPRNLWTIARSNLSALRPRKGSS